MNHKLTGMSHLYESTSHTMFTGQVDIVLNEDDPDAPYAELKVRDKVFRYTDPAQIAVMADLLSTIETTHTSFEMPVYID